ncbi:MAG: M48 family metallopeptidase [Clostridia bacterium]|nr:M48 family metallopeptidase [Clostridia bacterium]
MILKDVRSNKIESTIIITVFLIVVTLIVYFVCQYFELGIASVAIALAFSICASIFTYYNSDKIVLSLHGAREATEEEYRLLNNILDNLCIASGLPRPKLYVIDDPSPNAFATGRNPQNAVICFTTGIIEKLDKYELEGVMAHELSHIKNYDILLSTVVTIFVGLIVMLSDIFLHFRVRRSDDNEKGGAILMIVGLIALILSPIFASLMQLALSRKREYLADASAVEITRNPQGLIDALIKISGDRDILGTANKATAHMYIINPLKAMNSRGEISELFSTHPPIEKRIERLQNIR